MAKLKGYERLKTADEGLGLGGNPNFGTRPEFLNDSKDAVEPLRENEIVINPPATEKTLTKQDFLTIMKEGVK